MSKANYLNVFIRRLGSRDLKEMSEKEKKEFNNILNSSEIHVNFKNSSGETALIYASYNGQADIAEALLEHGANIEQTNSIEDTPLMLACVKNTNYPKKLLTVKLLLSRGANIHALNKNAMTALSIAERDGFTDVITLLEKHIQHERSKEEMKNNIVDLHKLHSIILEDD